MSTAALNALRAKLRAVSAGKRGAHWQMADRALRAARLLQDRNPDAAAEHFAVAKFHAQFC